MAYIKQNWVDDESVMSALRLNHMEDGIDAANQMYIQNITVDSGVVAGEFIYKDGAVWKKDNTAEQNLGTHIFDGTDARCLGVMACPAYLTLTAADIDYSLYIQQDGRLGFGTTRIVAAKVMSISQLFIDFNPVNEKPKAYTNEMDMFFAISGVSGHVKVKAKMPSDADGFRVCAKTEEWLDGEDETTGTQVADITDDSTYYGANNFLDIDVSTVVGDGTRVYLKAFPYRGGVYNTTAGTNETSAVVGKFSHWYTMDNNSGSTVYDDAGTIDATATNITFTEGIVDACAQGAGSGYMTLGSSISPSGRTIALRFKTNGTNESGILGRSDAANNAYPGVWYSNGAIYAGQRDGSLINLTYRVVSVNTWYFVLLKFSTNAVVSLSIDGDAFTTAPGSSYDFLIKNIGLARFYDGIANGFRYLNGYIDDVMVFDYLISNEDDINNLVKLIVGGLAV